MMTRQSTIPGGEVTPGHEANERTRENRVIHSTVVPPPQKTRGGIEEHSSEYQPWVVIHTGVVTRVGLITSRVQLFLRVYFSFVSGQFPALSPSRVKTHAVLLLDRRRKESLSATTHSIPERAILSAVRRLSVDWANFWPLLTIL